MQITIKPNSLTAKLAARIMKASTIAIVFGNTIHLYNCSRIDFLKDRKWVSHEVAHVLQYQRTGFFKFILLYLFECSRKGYFNNKFEAEAREKENDNEILNGIKFL